jgi:FtsP/CotA-like multicopper oxidase with cupredoxin domain
MKGGKIIMSNKVIKGFTGVIFSLIFLTVMVSTASAQVYELCTGRVTLAMPDGTPVDAWGFGIDDASADCTTASVPGPILEVAAGGPAALTVILRNTLPDPVSLNILGQILSPNNGPVWSELDGTGVTNQRAMGNYTARMRSFAHEADPSGGMATFTWPNFKPGTYMLTSGTNPAKQVQMGLYTVVKMDAAPGVAYADNPDIPGDQSVRYDKELILVYSEMDPVMQTAIDAGTYGYHADPVPAGWITSSLHRDPKYFLINGKAYPDAGLEQVIFAAPYDRVLVRFLNAGYNTHVPQLLNMYMRLVAEDGNLYSYPRQQYGIQLPAGKTMDAILTRTTDGTFSIHDAALNLTNGGSATPGGMLAYYAFGCVGDIVIDGQVNFADLALLKANFFTTCTPGTECVGDINNDNAVNFADLALLKANFFRGGCPVPAVP